MNKSILDYINSDVEPLPYLVYGNGYCCSAYLKDGTYLPCCVMFRESSAVVKLAVRRFEQEKKEKEFLVSKMHTRPLLRILWHPETE